jgi:hypothetical protein
MVAVGQTEPSSFVGGTAELASIADAGEAWRPSTVGPVIVAAGAPQTGRHCGQPSSQQRAITGRRSTLRKRRNGPPRNDITVYDKQ